MAKPKAKTKKHNGARKGQRVGGALLAHRGAAALREIQKQQKSTKQCVPKVFFRDNARDALKKAMPTATPPFLVQPGACEAIHELAEDLIVKIMARAVQTQKTDKKETLLARHFRTAAEFVLHSFGEGGFGDDLWAQYKKEFETRPSCATDTELSEAHTADDC